METGSNLRIDKWLWAVRIFKTRSQATDACRAGKVTIREQSVKPSHEVKVGEILLIRMHLITKTVKVTALLHNRVSAKLVNDYLEDLTTQEEYDKLKQPKENFEFRERGLGRPTKLQRRQIDKLKRNAEPK